MKTVLVVDDHAATREGYAAFLRECGYRVIEARHGGEAILCAQRNDIDAVLLDIVMPGLDGVETAEWLRQISGTADTPILAITASPSEIERERMRALCNDLLAKPCSPGTIVRRVDALTGVTNAREDGGAAERIQRRAHPAGGRENRGPGRPGR